MSKNNRPSGSDKEVGADLPEEKARNGFLPMQTNLWDRCFISIILWVAISLLWFRFFEQFATIHIATAISAVLAVLIIWKG